MQEVERPYERFAQELAERGKVALNKLTGQYAGAHVYSRGKRDREGLDFLVKFYTNASSFEAHCVGASCELYQVVNDGQTLSPIAWEGEEGAHTADDLTEDILEEVLRKSVEDNKNIAAHAAAELK